MECKPGGPSCNAFLLFWRFCLSCLRPCTQTIMLKFFAVNSVSSCLSWHLVHQLSFCIKCKSGYSVHSLHCDTAKFSVSNMIDDQFTFCGKFFLTDPALYKGCNINLSIVQMQKEIANVNAGLGFCRAQDVLYKMCGIACSAKARLGVQRHRRLTRCNDLIPRCRLYQYTKNTTTNTIKNTLE